MATGRESSGGRAEGSREREAPASAAVVALFFTSGFLALVYEVLWLKELRLVFGSTAPAAATTLAAFFLGLAAGSRAWGGRAARSSRPLRLYALLELGVAATALGYLALGALYAAVYPWVYSWLAGSSGALLAAKFLLALVVLFPPAFFMGGTLPVMSQAVVHRRSNAGWVVAGLYGLNTLGAASGAWLAGFVLPAGLGFRTSYVLAIGMSGLVAVGAWRLDLRRPALPRAEPPRARAASKPRRRVPLGRPTIRLLAFGSGVFTLALEVLWTQMLARSLQNSVFTFSVILTLFLVGLALGGLLAHYLLRRGVELRTALSTLLAMAALLTGLSPWLFSLLSSGLASLGGEAGWTAYVLRAYGTAALVVLPPTVAGGSVFPLLFRLGGDRDDPVGATIGDLAALNTAGAILGALGAGFVLLNGLGLWGSLRMVVIGYALAALLVSGGAWRTRTWPARFAAAAVLLVAGIQLVSPLPRSPSGEERKGARLLELREGSSGAVSVLQRGDELEMRLNGHYLVGDTANRHWEEVQAHLPLLLHPRPRAVFFLGMGTGITAGAALEHEVEDVVVAELVPEIVAAARSRFRSFTHGLFEDPRARIVEEDGRSFLLGTDQTFDVIVGDLFVPWRAGVGSVYSREHFELVRRRLRKGGLFAQWLPLYEMSREEFGIVARTMAEVFPTLTLWRGDFHAERPIVALVGQKGGRFHPGAVRARLAADGHPARLPSVPNEAALERATGLSLRAPLARLLLSYCGNLGEAADLLAAHPVETDDRPRIEYRAPVTQREVFGGREHWLVGLRLARLLEELQAAVPPGRDPYLAALTPLERRLPKAGRALYRAAVLARRGEGGAAEAALNRFAQTAAPALAEPAEGASSRRTLREEIQRERRAQEHRRKEIRALEARLEALERGR